LLRDPALRTSMGEAGRRRVEQLFNIHGTCAAIKAIYGDLMRSPRATGRVA